MKFGQSKSDMENESNYTDRSSAPLNVNANKPGEKDKKRSGDYVIHSTRHSFNVTDQRHQIDMHGVKLGNPR